MITKTLCVFSVLLLTATSCHKAGVDDHHPDRQPEPVKAPFPGLDPEYTSFAFDNAKADTFRLGSGTRIAVPRHAFVDSAGNVVEGGINIRYREFHSALDIFLAGVPMHIGEGANRRQLQTAGMFEMRASKDGTRLSLAEDKSIDVRFGSRVRGKDYNLFTFDDSTGNWRFKGYSAQEPNPQYRQSQRKVKKLQRTRKHPLGPKYFIFNYQGALDVYYNLYKQEDYSYSDNPAIKERIEGYGLSWLDIWNQRRIRFDGQRTVMSFILWKRLSNDSFPRWVIKGDYIDKRIRHISGDTYLFEIKNEQGASYATRIRGVMPLRSLLAYEPEYWQNHYQEAMEEIKQERKRMRTQAKVFRSFEVNNMGYSNFDRLLKLQDPIRVKASFSVDPEFSSEVYSLERVFCLPGGNRSVVQISVKDTNKILLDASDMNFRIITTLPGSRLGMVPRSQYRNLNFDSLQQEEEPFVSLRLKALDDTIDSRKQLEKMLEMQSIE